MNEFELLENAVLDLTGKTIPRGILERIKEKYEGRTYHNLAHARRVAILVAHPMEKAFGKEWMNMSVIAAFFHDIEQDPFNDSKAIDRSIQRMHDYLLDVLPFPIRKEVAELIQATIGWTSSAQGGLLRDADYEILAHNDYFEYANAIEKEITSQGVGKDVFNKYRIKFLKDLLAKPTIFLTPQFGMWEWNARINIQDELAKRIAKLSFEG